MYATNTRQVHVCVCTCMWGCKKKRKRKRKRSQSPSHSPHCPPYSHSTSISLLSFLFSLVSSLFSLFSSLFSLLSSLHLHSVFTPSSLHLHFTSYRGPMATKVLQMDGEWWWQPDRAYQAFWMLPQPLMVRKCSKTLR